MTPVKADRQADFESFIGEVIDPAVQRVRPQLGPLWRVLRPAGPSEGAATYALLFYGDATLDDWDLGARLEPGVTHPSPRAPRRAGAGAAQVRR